MPRSKLPRPPSGPADFRGLCKLCWHPPAKGERTLNGYHIECAKEAAEIIARHLHERRGIVYEQWYRKRHPSKVVPGMPVPGQLDSKGE